MIGDYENKILEKSEAQTSARKPTKISHCNKFKRAKGRGQE